MITVTPAQARRIAALAAGLAALALALGLALTQLEGALVYFRTPTELAAARPPPGERIRIGGMVRQWQRAGRTHIFEVTDFTHTLVVEYVGLVPDLMRVGQGVVAEGAFAADGRFLADIVLARHDENYMPPEAAAALEASQRAPVRTPEPTAPREP